MGRNNSLSIDNNVITRSSSKTMSLYSWSEIIFMLYLFLYLIVCTFRNTMFDLWGYFAIQKLLVLSGIFLAVFRMYTFYISSKKRGSNRKTSMQHLLFTGFISLSFMASFISTGYMFLAFLAILFPCCLGIDYKKVFAIHFTVLLAVFLSALLGSFSGNITDLVYIYTRSNDDGTTFLRSSLGTIYPTDCASFVFYLFITAFILFSEVSEWLFAAIGVILALGFWFINNAQNNSRFTILLVLLMVFMKLILVIGKKFTVVEKLWSGLLYVSSLAAPVLAALMYIGCRYYASIKETNINRANKLDQLLHSRLSLGAKGLEDYGISLFGTAFDMIGFGGVKGSQDNYFFLDSSYMLILLRYGFIILVLVCIMMVFTSVIATKKKDYRISIVILVLAGDFFLEHHAVEVCYNISILLPFMMAAPSVRLTKKKITGRVLRFVQKISRVVVDSWVNYKKSYLLSLAIVTIIALVTSPVWISLLRTINTLWGFTPESGKLGSTVFLALLWLFLSSLLCISLWRHKAFRIIGLVLLVVCLLLMCSLILIKKDASTPYIESDRTAIEAINSVKGTKLYSAEYPLLYMSKYKGISLSPLPIEEMARLSDISIIVEKTFDSDVFISRGFLYTEISDTHSIYTNSMSASEALQKAGFIVRGYYSTISPIDYNSNKVYQQLSGNYELVLSIKVNNAKDLGYVDVASVSVNAAKGEKNLLDRTIYSNELDEEGRVKVSYKYYANNSDVSYNIKVAEGIDCTIEEAYFHRSVDQDMRRYYNNKWRIIREEYLGEDGNMILSNGGYAAVEYDYNSRGDVIKYKYYDENNKPVLLKDGYSAIEQTYDNEHRVLTCYYFGIEGERVLYKGLYAEYEFQYDDSGYETDVTYYNMDGSKGVFGEEYVTRHKDYNEKYQVIRESYMDSEGNLCMNEEGYAFCTMEYDDNGNPVLWKYFDTSSNLVLNNKGYAQLHRVYDSNKSVIEESFYDIDGNPVSITNGQVGEERVYDDKGRVVARKYYGEDGNPVLYKDMYAEIQYEYDLNGRESKITYIDIDGELGINGDTYAIVKKQYNSDGKVSRETYYDAKDNPVLVRAGYHYSDYTYDEEGRRSSIEYYGINQELVLCNNAYAKIVYEYDEKGRENKQYYYDIDGNPGRNNAPYVAYYKEYDDDNNVIIHRYLNADNTLCLSDDGYAERHCLYTDGNLVEESYFGENGEPVLFKNQYAKIHYEYDDKKRVISKYFYDVSGTPKINGNTYSSYTVKYNDNNKVIEECYLDAEGILVNVNDGYAKKVTNYNDDFYVNSFEYYGEDGTLVKSENHREYCFISDMKDYIKDKNNIIFVTIKDEATKSLSKKVKDEIKKVGLLSLSELPYYGSYIGIIDGGTVVYDKCTNDKETMSYQYKDIASLQSGGYYAGNISSCIIDGNETSKNGRGINVVVYDKVTGKVVDSITYDTWAYPVRPLSEW